MIDAAKGAVTLKRGAVHVFGDDVPLDEGVMAFKYAIERVDDPALLIPHLFEVLDPGFAARVKHGDLVIAGRNFGHGKPHVQGLIAMAALGMGILCESMPHKALRRAVAVGLPVLTGLSNREGFAQNGDSLEVDFGTGWVANSTRRTNMQLAPMPQILLDIVAAGGAAGALAAWLADHPEQRLQAEPVA